MHIRQYLSLIVKDWVSRMSGIASVVLSLVVTYWSSLAIVWRTLFSITAFICFLLASFWVWKKERKALEKEEAKNAAPDIKGCIDEILINQAFTLERSGADCYVTVKAAIKNARPISTAVRSFKLRIKVKGKEYSSNDFHTGGLRLERQLENSHIDNLANIIKAKKVLEHGIGEEGYIRFSLEGLFPPRYRSHDEGWSSAGAKDMFFNLEDVEDVSLIVTDYYGDYKIESSGIKPKWVNILAG